MIRRVDMYQCVCDRCGKACINEDEGFVAWADGTQAREQAYDMDWQRIDGKDYCPDCVEYEEETGEIIPKK